MSDANPNDLAAFLAVARERSFTRAAAKLGVSQSAPSQTVRGREDRLGLRMLARTTRSVATTEPGERLLRSTGPSIDGIEQELAAVGEMREKPAGLVRTTAWTVAVLVRSWRSTPPPLPTGGGTIGADAPVFAITLCDGLPSVGFGAFAGSDPSVPFPETGRPRPDQVVQHHR